MIKCVTLFLRVALVNIRAKHPALVNDRPALWKQLVAVPVEESYLEVVLRQVCFVAAVPDLHGDSLAVENRWVLEVDMLVHSCPAVLTTSNIAITMHLTGFTTATAS